MAEKSANPNKTLRPTPDRDHAELQARNEAAQEEIRRVLNEEWPSDVHPHVGGMSAVTPETQAHVGRSRRQ